MKRLSVMALLLGWMSGVALATPSAPRPSAGCGQAPGPLPELIEVDGRLRHAIVVLPDDYRPDRPHILVFGFHGRTNDNAKARRYFDLERPSSKPSIYLYPAGLADDSGNFTWWTSGERPEALRDFSLFDALLSAMARSFCIDLDAVYVVGHSLGASFTNSLACRRGDRIRGVVSVAGGINPTSCTGEAAAMIVHNPNDVAVPVSEGERARDNLLGHAARAGKIVSDKIGALACDRYRDGEDPLFWCLHHQDVTRRGRYYPHQWPPAMGEAISAFIDRFSGPGHQASEGSG